MAKDFVGHLTLNFSNDGLVYAADRVGNRIHVTDKQGKFIKEFPLAVTTGVGGAPGGVGFSPDKEQRYLFISDLTNNHIWFLNRADGKVVGQMGSMGDNGGQFYGLHMIAVDSTGQHLHGRGVRRRAGAAVRSRRQRQRKAAVATRHDEMNQPGAPPDVSAEPQSRRRF